MVFASTVPLQNVCALPNTLAQDVSKCPVQNKSPFAVSLKSAKWVAIDGAKIQESSIRVCQIECCNIFGFGNIALSSSVSNNTQPN